MTAAALILVAFAGLAGYAHTAYWRHQHAAIEADRAEVAGERRAVVAWQQRLTRQETYTGQTCTPAECAATISALLACRHQLDQLHAAIDELPGDAA